MSLLPTHWYYNTETGQLTQGNNLENLGNNLVGGAGWHELNIAGNATAAQAAAAAKQEFPTGATPTNAGITPARVASTAAGEAAQAAGLSGSGGSCCLIQIPVVGGCIITRTQARALVGGLILGASGIIGIIGLALLVVEGFEKSGAGAAAGKTLETVGAGVAFVPGLEPAGLAVGAAGGAARRGSSSASSSLARRRTARAQRGQSGPTTTSTTREPIESESGGTRITTTTTRPAGRGQVHERRRIEERTPGSHPGTSNRRVTETQQRRRA